MRKNIGSEGIQLQLLTGGMCVCEFAVLYGALKMFPFLNIKPQSLLLAQKEK